MTPLADRFLSFLPTDRVVTDDLRRLAYGTDASFYRLVPEVVVFADSEDEARAVISVCRTERRALTIRAAGTSLSGQAVTDGVLMVLGDGWRGTEILESGEKIRLGPAVVGAEANRLLAPYGRKIGPDPASINACKIGGIAANNASGMCCGTTQNSYQTLAGLRLMLADGTLVDTEDPTSVAAFRTSHASLLDALAGLAARVRADAPLAKRIRHKFRIKNTTGYSLNALIDFDDPLDILSHLMIGSEGTLGFMSRITYRTVVEHADKASAFLLFADIETACRAVMQL
jgi:D-lactate dehydrogenase